MASEQSPTYTPISGGDLLHQLVRNVFRILAVTIVATVVAVFVSLRIPNEYMSYANLMPSSTPSIGLDIFSGGGGIGSIAGSILGKQSREFDRFLILLGTHEVKERVIQRFNLIEVYEKKEAEFPMLETMKQLDANTAFTVFEEGNMVINVWDQDPQRAKDMADYYVELVNEYNIELSGQEARVFREFVENKYGETELKLDSLTRQSAAFQMMSQLEGRLLVEEVKLDLLGKTATENNPIYINQKALVDQLRTSMNELNRGASGDGIPRGPSESTEATAKLGRLMAEAEIQQEMLKYIVPLYESAKMEEVKSIPGLVVVDKPFVPERKDRPKRATIVIAVFFSAFILMVVYYTLQLIYRRNRSYFKQLRS